MPKILPNRKNLLRAWFIPTVCGYQAGSLIGFGSDMVFVELYCPNGAVDLNGLLCFILYLPLAVWVAGTFVGIAQLLTWNALVCLSRRWICAYALGWTGIMLLLSLLWITAWTPSNFSIDVKILFWLFGMALFYPAIVGGILLFNSPTKKKAFLKS
jgi:hypothetical protein